MDKNTGKLKKKDRICFVIPTLQAGGMERVMSELADYFVKKKNVELHLILYGRGRSIFYKLPGSVIIHRPDWPFDNSKRLWHTFKTIVYLRKTIKRLQPDRILSFGEYWNSFVLMALKGLNIPIFVSDRCRPDKNLGRKHEILRRLLYPFSAGIIAQTSFAKDVYLEKKLNKNISVINNPIRELKAAIPSPKKENIILSVGRLIDTKHHDHLIQIFGRVNKDDWRLVIAGGDAIKQKGMEKLKTLIKELNLTNQVTLTGTVDNVEEYYHKSKIFAFTSSSEGFPNVIGEAMSAGLPIVTYNCVAGPADMVKDGENGYLVDLFDDKTFEHRLRELMNDEDLRERMGKKSRKLIQRFSVDTIGEKYFMFLMGKE